MRKIERLRLKALESCKFRGHTMGRFNRMNRNWRNSRCIKCGMEVYIDAKPAPNGIDIGGKAVALHCTEE